MNDREKWLAERRLGIGGSDIAAVLGLSPWATPYDVWLDKRGEGKEVDPDTPALYWGTILEDVVAKEYGKRTGNKIQRVNAAMVHPEHTFARANIDRAVVNPSIAGRVMWKDGRLTTDKILECKTANGFVADMWGEQDTDGVPPYYLLQVMWYLGITGAEYGDLSVLIGGSDFRTYTMARDEELIGALFEEGAKFWKLVQDGTMPDPKTMDDAKRMWPQHIAGQSVVVDMSIVNDCRRLADLKAQAKEIEKEADAAQVRICAAFGDAEEITNGGERIATWKTQTSRRLDGKALKEAHPEIAELFTDEASTRVLRLAKAAKAA